MSRNKLSQKDIGKMVTLYQRGAPKSHIATAFSVDHSTVHYHLNKLAITRTEEAETISSSLKNNYCIEIPADDEDIYIIAPKKPKIAKFKKKKPKCYNDYIDEHIALLEARIASGELNEVQLNGHKREIKILQSTKRSRSVYLHNLEEW